MEIMRDLQGDKRIAWAAGVDAANRYMKELGRGGQPWTAEAYNVAVRTYQGIVGPEIMDDDNYVCP